MKKKERRKTVKKIECDDEVDNHHTFCIADDKTGFELQNPKSSQNMETKQSLCFSFSFLFFPDILLSIERFFLVTTEIQNRNKGKVNTKQNKTSIQTWKLAEVLTLILLFCSLAGEVFLESQ